MQWHQLHHMQTICTLLQTDNNINTSSLNFFYAPDALVTPNQQCQNTESNISMLLTQLPHLLFHNTAMLDAMCDHEQLPIRL